MFDLLKKQLGYMPPQERNFKGTESEHEVVKLEKAVKEASRMLTAHEIKVSTNQEHRIHTPKETLEARLDQAVEEFTAKAGNRRFNRVMEEVEELRESTLERYTEQ